MKLQTSVLLASVLVLRALSLAAQAPPPPGKLVDIGGQRLHVHCAGTGAPTVLLESGSGDFSVIWAFVQPAVARSTRVCSYDRAGYAWSEPGRSPRTFAQLALELHTALEQLGIGAPFVLVGQSYGGLVVRGFAEKYPREVSGMILVDGVHEDQHSVWGGEAHLLRASAKGRTVPSPHIERDTALQRRAAAEPAAAIGNQPLDAPLDRLPASAQAVWRWAEALRAGARAREAELDWSPEEMERMHWSRLPQRATLGDLPLIVLARTTGGYASGLNISADSLERERRALQQDLAALSTRGKLVFAKRSGHNIHLEDPELVIGSILDIVQTARHQR